MRLPQPAPRTLPERLAVVFDRLVRHLEGDRPQIHYWFTTFRSKEPLLLVLDAFFDGEDGWASWTMADLSELAPATLDAASVAADEASTFRMWARHTEDMPTTYSERVDLIIDRLILLVDDLLPRLGGVPPDPTQPRWPDAWTTLHR